MMFWEVARQDGSVRGHWSTVRLNLQVEVGLSEIMLNHYVFVCLPLAWVIFVVSLLG